MTEYTVRLPDGKDYGPVDEAGLRRWFEEGRIAADAWVLPAGAADWVPLNTAFDLRAWPAPLGTSTVPFATPSRRPASPRPGNEGGGGGASASASGSGSGSGSGGRTAAILVSVLAVVGLGVFAVRSYLAGSGSPRQRAVREWASADREFLDAEHGLTLRLPDGWVLLRKDSPLVTAEVKAKLGDLSQGAVGSLTIESVPLGIATLEHYVDRVVEDRQRIASGFRETSRADRLLGTIPAKTVVTTWSSETGAWRGMSTFWQDGWDYFVLSASCPEVEAATLAARFDALQGGVTHTQPLTARMRAETAKVAEAAPQLSATAAELLVREGMRRGISADEMAQSSFGLVSKGYVVLTPEEVRELGQIYSEVYAPISPEDRIRLAAYLSKIRARQSTLPAEDQEMRGLMKAGVLGLPEPNRQRLQQLFEKALTAGLAGR